MLSNFFYRKSSLVVAIAITSITLGYLFFFFLDAAKCFQNGSEGIEPLATSFGFSLTDVEAFLKSKNDQMMQCYVDFNVIWDNVFALLYGFMYVAWVSLSLKPFKSKFKVINLFPFLQTLFDWLENMSLANITQKYMSTSELVLSDVQLSSFFNQAKWIVAVVIMLLIGIGIVMRLRQYLSQKRL